MADDLMTRCETKRLYKINGVKEWRWIEVAVADVDGDGDGEREIRCAYCHGAIKVLKAPANGGAAEHAKHRTRVDTDNCQGGRGPRGATGRSSKPVE